MDKGWFTMELSDMFWNASLEELERGYLEEPDDYLCLLCGKKIEKGIVYSGEGVLYEASRYIRVHIEQTHGSVFEHLIGLDKRLTGLTDHQNRLLRLFYEGKGDEAIQKELGIGSSATIRNHRFGLREKERQAKVFLTLMELLKTRDRTSPRFIAPHDTARMVDDRYKITPEENDKILERYFPKGPGGPLKTFEMKEKNKLVILRQIAKRFEPDRLYSEAEINAILKTAYPDYVTLRRYLIEYGFMGRKPDGSQYWLLASETSKV